MVSTESLFSRVPQEYQNTHWGCKETLVPGLDIPMGDAGETQGAATLWLWFGNTAGNQGVSGSSDSCGNYRGGIIHPHPEMT